MRVWVTGARTILIVEDEPLIAMMLEDFLESLGHVVKASCDNVADALKAVALNGFDLAILDVNLKGENVWPVAAELRQRGVPFILASGGHVDPPPPEFAGAPLIEKPFTIDRVTPALEAALARRPSVPRSGNSASFVARPACAGMTSWDWRKLAVGRARCCLVIMIASMQTQTALPDRRRRPAWAAAAQDRCKSVSKRPTATRSTASTSRRRPAAKPRTLILGFGGNAWNGSDVAAYLHQIFPQADVIAFHYRGYRPSTGSPSAEALLADAPLVHDFRRRPGQAGPHRRGRVQHRQRASPPA